jgi:hypothetical protein
MEERLGEVGWAMTCRWADLFVKMGRAGRKLEELGDGWDAASFWAGAPEAGYVSHCGPAVASGGSRVFGAQAVQRQGLRATLARCGTIGLES